MDLGILLSLALIPLCLIVLALDVAAETALTRISRLRLHQLVEHDVPHAALISQWVHEPRLQTVLRAANLVMMMILAALVVDLASYWWHDMTAIITALAVLTPITLVFSLLAPQGIAARNPERAALLLTGYVSVLRLLLGPPLNSLYWLARPLAHFLNRGRPAGHYITEEEIRELVDSDEPSPIIPSEEEELIQQIFEFGDTVVRGVMVPRTDIIAVADHEPLPAVVDRILEHGYTRLPVYHETIDNILGVVNAKDLLRAYRQGQADQPLTLFIRPVHFIPETKKVGDLLRDMQLQRLPIALVIDEYGGTAGLVTVEDVVEEIVGEIQDEYDREAVLVEVLGPAEWRCDARLPLDDLNDLLGIDLEGVDVETVGGLVQERLGHIPRVGEFVTEDDVVITVQTTEGLRIKQLHVRRGAPAAAPPPPPAPGPESAPSTVPATTGPESPAAPVH